MNLTHFDGAGRARMVDVGAKDVTARVAVASGAVLMRPETFELIAGGRAAKGDVLGVARIAGIMAAKRTGDLIPLCHPLQLTAVTVDFRLDRGRSAVEVEARVETVGRTGVEMEALTAVSVAALTIYDMCKAVDRAMTIDGVRLIEKSGGRSGHFVRDDDARPGDGVQVGPPVVSIVGPSASGKTTLIEKLLAELVRRGYRVATIKHDVHSFQMDHPGKDTYRHAAAGAEVVIISSPEKMAMIRRTGREIPLAELVDLAGDVDLVITEGYKRGDRPKIEVFRNGDRRTLVCADDPSLIAVASAAPVAAPVPRYDWNDAAGIADLIVERFFRGGRE